MAFRRLFNLLSGRRERPGAWACGVCVSGVLKRLGAAKRGSIALMTALFMLVIIGGIAFAVDLSRLYLVRMDTQRIADQSAIAGAFAYMQNSSSPTSAATAAAQGIATANGAGSATVTASIVSSPSGDGNDAVEVAVQVPVSLSPFGQLLRNSSASVNVSTTAYSEITDQVGPCVIALNKSGASTINIALTGGTQVIATDCAVASGDNITATNGTTITAQAVYAVGTATGTGITTTPIANQIHNGASAPTDPYNPTGGAVTSNPVYLARLPTVSALTAPSFPTSVGSAPSGGSAQSCSGTLNLAAGSTFGAVSDNWASSCTINLGTASSSSATCGSSSATTSISGGLSLSGGSSSSPITVNFCPGTYKINGGIALNGGSYVVINITSPVILDVWGGINNSGNSFIIHGPATYNVQGGITQNGGGGVPLTFDNNGGGTSTFYVSGGIKVENSGPTTFPAGTYVITSGDGTAGIDTSGGSSTTFGNGSFQIAKGINLGSGGTLTFGSAASSSSVFQVDSTDSSGDAVDTGGGSYLTIGAFPNVDLNGSFVPQGSVVLGGSAYAGTYTINGNLNALNAGGYPFSATNTSIIASGWTGFGAGFNNVTITAPTAITSTTNGTLPTIAVAALSSSASTIDSGAYNTKVTGAYYVPYAALTFDGAGTLYGGTAGSSCVEVIAGSIAVDAGGGISTTCPNLGSSGSSSTVKLIQ